MKITLLFLSLSALHVTIFAQNKDSLLAAEMKRLNRLGDSLHKVQLARESTSVARMNEMVRKTNQDIADAKYKEVESLTEQVLAQHRKEKQRKRMAALLTIAAFGVAALAGAFIAKRRKKYGSHH